MIDKRIQRGYMLAASRNWLDGVGYNDVHNMRQFNITRAEYASVCALLVARYGIDIPKVTLKLLASF